jgi:hypothetical protein
MILRSTSLAIDEVGGGLTRLGVPGVPLSPVCRNVSGTAMARKRGEKRQPSASGKSFEKIERGVLTWYKGHDGQHKAEDCE